MPETRGRSVELRRLLERLSDVELAEMLRDEHCDGPVWLLVREDLARCALGTLHRCIRDGSLAARTRGLGRPVVLDDDELRTLCADDAARTSVVVDAVVFGLDAFREHGILDELWRPHAASLRTYAVNACLREASRAVRGWRRSRRRIEEPVADPQPEQPDPADRLDVDAALGELPEPLRSAARIRLCTGRSWASIAPEIGTTARRLESQLRRFRQEHGRRHGGDAS